MQLRVASFNIHACIGTDGRFDPARIAAVIREIDADVLALQEVEHHLLDNEDLLDYLARTTGYHAVAGPTLMRETRHYGNALLTRLPVINSQSRDISVPPYEPRAVIEARLGAGEKTLTVMATHLGLWPAERRMQVRQILSLLEQQPTDMTVLLGDLNEWFLWGRPLRWLHKHFRTSRHIRTFPTNFPLFSLDRIWVTPENHLLELHTHRTELSRKASDHLPIVAEIQL
ncbi:MAG: endonuclease/exonuclease/phosphatase family protein [Methylophaga sp.]|nr:endonuclease/exonuclease/phosphatase family protein [Methylophaga sp.]